MIVCNTLIGAVSEYDRCEFHSITPTHAGSADGLFSLTGGTDGGLPIEALVRVPTTLLESSQKTRADSVYLSIRGDGEAELSVHGPENSRFADGQVWSYRFLMRPSGETRCVLGRGIRENYLGFSVRTPDGQFFTLDRIELLIRNVNRRI